MKRRLRRLSFLALLFGAVASSHAIDPASVPTSVAPIVLNSPQWQLEISPLNGAITKIADPNDPNQMNWVHADRSWGIVRCRIPHGGAVTFDHPASVTPVGSAACDAVYTSASLRLLVHRALDDQGRFLETFTFTNIGNVPLAFPQGAIFITVPFNDSYKDGAPTCLTHNCNAHLWAGGASSWANAIRMGGEGSQLGLVLTQGSLASYSILEGAGSNDRGNLALNLDAFNLNPGESATLSWTLFWHQDWIDFWAFLTKQPSFVRLQADSYTVVQGGSIAFTAESSAPLTDAVLRVNDAIVPTTPSGGKLTASVKTDHLGEYLFDLENHGQHSWMRANAIVDPLALIKARVEFIVRKQQKNAPGAPLDGAFLPYDNETEATFCDQIHFNNHNEGRERLGMGVLVALYLPLCQDAALSQELSASLDKYETFVERELQDSQGRVFDQSGYKGVRPYNYPWVAHLHLAAYEATHDKKYLALFVKTYRAFSRLKTKAIDYMIGNQILDGFQALKEAGMQSEYDEMLALFRVNADAVEQRGVSYPSSEVIYEQSIVGPGVQIELEMYLVTGDPKYLASAKQQLKCLEAFNGQQPDYHQNDLGIRHWDDYWFGKLGLYGDTFPHYWSTITAVAFDEYADAASDDSYRARARTELLDNMCLFTPDGRGSCAYVYPATLNGRPGNRLDPWANDQDWALVNYLTVRDRHPADVALP